MSELRKQVTDNPLLDEIIYDCQIMIKDIVLKDEYRANQEETMDALKQFDTYKLIVEGNAKFEFFKYTYNHISKITTIPYDLAVYYTKNNYAIPEQYHETLLNIYIEDFMNNYIELNNYYRMLNGKPNIGESKIYISAMDLLLLEDYNIDYSKSIDEMNNTEIEILRNAGIIDSLKTQYPDCEYLNHLGIKSIDPYKARKAAPFSILYIPTIEATEVYKKYIEKVNLNREYYLRTMYSDAYRFRSDYYDRYIMILIILEAFIDMINSSAEYIIDRELFDLRTIEYVFEASGVEFFPEIPLKYQKRLVKNLNRLIKYSSCKKNIMDIAQLFGFDDIEIYKYYLIKEPRVDENGNYYNFAIEDPETGEDIVDIVANYDLKFLKVPIDDSYDKYVNDDINYLSYNDVTDNDKYWNGIYSEDVVKYNILQKNFNIDITKYMSVDAVYSLTDMAFNLVYFINMLMYIDYDTTKLKIQIPELSNSEQFPLIDCIICLYSLSYLYYGVSDKIMYDPEQILAVKGFNFKVDMNKLRETIADMGYNMDDFMSTEFIIPKEGYIDFDNLVDIYHNNKNLYISLLNGMNNANDYDEYRVYKILFESLMITRLSFSYFNKFGEDGKPPITYNEILREKNSGLYQIIMKCESLDGTSQENQNEISKYINIIVDNIYTYLDSDEFRFIFQGIPTVSLDFIRDYLFKVIDFFKSYKVTIIDGGIIYKIDDLYENKIHINDRIEMNYSMELNNEVVEVHDHIAFDYEANIEDNVKLVDMCYIYPYFS